MSEIKSVCRRFITMLLSMIMILTLTPISNLDTIAVYAATSGTVTGLNNTNIGLSFTGTADNAWSANETTITGTATSAAGACGDTAYNSTLTITNNRSSEATLSFSYTVVVNKGTIQVDGVSKTANGTYSKTLSAGSSIKVYIKSGSTSDATTITLSNVALISDVTATTTFQPAENGSYTVDGIALTEDTSKTQSSKTAYTLAATPADGYQFLGWYDVTNSKYISTTSATSVNIESDCTLTAKFVTAGSAIFETSGQPYADLSEAVTYAQSNSQSKITLIGSGSITGSYTIPSGITLLIPYDSNYILSTTTPGIAPQSTSPASKNTLYKKLTLADGASLTVDGAISVGGRYRSASGSAPGYMAGAYGQIMLNGSSKITVKNGGSLYAWGFVSGEGTVECESNSNVYEWFQVADFRGGSASMGIGNKVFPFSQYYIQNVECALQIDAGATENCYTGIFAMSKEYASSVPLVGDSGMFKLTSGSLTKKYDGAADRMVYTVDGVAELNTLSLSVMENTINSANYVLPITNNMTVNIKSGSTFTTKQTAALQPGASVNIENGAVMTVADGYNLYVYDSAEWGNYTCLGQFSPVKFAPGETYTRTNAKDIVDAKINVDGTLVSNGNLYTTSSGAAIVGNSGSTGNGGIFSERKAAPTDTTTYQYTQNGSTVTAIPIAVTAAKLRNSDSSYQSTSNDVADTNWEYIKGTWKNKAGQVGITFDKNSDDATGTMEVQTVDKSADTALTKNTYNRTGYTFAGWNTKADGSGTSYADGANINISEDITLYAQWKANTYTVTWTNDDGTVLEKDENVIYGSKLSYDGMTPSKNATDVYTYTFAGWDPAITDDTTVTSDATYKATYTETKNKYTVTWKNDDGTVLKIDSVEYGATPSYTGNTPTKTADAQYTYSFSGWSPEITTITGDSTYTAQYVTSTNTYTVKWVNYDDTELKTMTGVPYGTTVTYDGATPTRASNAQYTYTFSGWTPEISSVTGDITYKATYTSTVNKYTVTWKNGNDTLKAEEVEYGSIPSYSGDTPTRDATAQYTYVFDSWNTASDGTGDALTDQASVTSNVTYYAQFTETVNSYTITWKNADGTELKSEQVEYGKTPSYTGDTPTKEEDAAGTYTFEGWAPEVKAVDGDATYTATYKTTPKTYTVTWKNYDGTVLETDKDVAYGSEPSFDGATPARANDNDYSYNFVGWSNDDGTSVTGTGTVTGDMTYTAVFKATALVKHTVKFEANGGTGTMDTQTFVEGTETALNGNHFSREGYAFTGWNTAADGAGEMYADCGSLAGVKADLTLYAQWKHNDGWLNDETGKQYYKDGEVQKTGWTTIDNSVYYLDPATGYAAVDGIYWLPYPDGYGADSWDINNNSEYVSLGYDKNSYFLFDSDGVFKSGTNGMTDISAGTKVVGGKASAPSDLFKVWAVNGEIPWHPGLVISNGAYYYFPTGYFEKGSSYIKGRDYTVSKTNDLSWPESVNWGTGTFVGGKYTFDIDGKMMLYDGFTDLGNETYYYVKGVKTYAGLIQVDGSYYYVNSACKVVKGCDYTISKTNNLLPSGKYTFGSDGKLQTSTDSEGNLKNGIVKESDGIWYYYVNGVKTYAGLIKIDNDYYYVNSRFEVVHGRNYFISKTNGMMDNGTYEFDSEGKMVTKNTSKNGIVKESDSSWYYYVNGVKTYAGLIQIDGNYYYIRTSGEVVHGQSYYVSKVNDTGFKAGRYAFDSNGKMVIEKSSDGNALNGIVKQDDGTWYYYINGEKYYAGLIQIDGNYYYVRTSGEVVHGQRYFISKTNGLMKNGTYTFDENGIMLEN